MNQPRLRPNNFQDAFFVGADFDNTIALTGVAPENFIGIERAYETAVEKIFGSAGLTIYRAGGGLLNRAPVEVIRQLAPDASEEDTRDLLGRLNTTRLDILIGQIGSEWPEPTKGFIAFAKALEDSKKEGSPISSIIISSGHDPFIQRTYDVWGVEKPDVILAQEQISTLAEKQGIATPVKPDPILMLWAYNAWRSLHALPEAKRLSSEDIPRIIYAGDDSEKDGKLARSQGVLFKLIRPEDAAKTWQEIAFLTGLGRLALES